MDKIKLFKLRDIGDVIQDAFGIATKQAQPLWGNVLKILVPLYAAIAVITGLWQVEIEAAQGDLSGVTDPQEVFGLVMSMFSGVKASLIMLLSVIAQVLMYGFTLNFMRLSQGGGEASEDEIRSSAFSDAGWMLGFQILTGLIVGFAMLFFIIPGIYLAVVMSILMAVATIEKLSFGDAFARCRALVNDNWWNTFLVLLLVGLLTGVLGSVASGLFGLVGGTAGKITAALAQSAVGVFFGVINIIAVTLQYYNLRIKHDGGAFDDGENSVINEIGGDEENTRMM